MYYELGLLSVIVAGTYWGWYYLRRRTGTVLFGSLLMLAVVLCGLGLIGRYADGNALGALGAIGVGGGACMLVVAPALRNFARRLAAGERYGAAARLLDVADILAPGSGVAEDKALLGAMREIRDGKIEQTVDALTAAKTGAPAEAKLAIDERIAMLYLAAYRWEEGVKYAEAHLWPQLPTITGPAPAEAPTPIALRRVLGLAAPVWVELVGAYGRTGDLDRAAGLLAQLEDACAGRGDAQVWLYRARLMFLALAGRVTAVEALTTPGHARHLGAAARTYWRGVALERHGETAAATAAYAKARDQARGKSRDLVDQAIAKLPQARAAQLGTRATEVIARVEALPPPKLARGPRIRGPVVTWGLTATIVLVQLVVAVLLGDSGDPAVSLREGAVAHTQIDAGEWWRLASAVYVHIGVPHMILNAIGLWIIGRVCEELLGSWRTLAIFLVAGFAGTTVSYLANESGIAAGASGGVMGLLGAVFVELSLHRDRYRALWKRGVWGGLAIVLVAEVGLGFLFPAVDQWQHGTGIVVGAMVGALLAGKGAVRQWLARVLAVAGVIVSIFAAVQVARTSLVDSLTGVPMRAWQIDRVTLDAPAAWTTNDGELVDSDIFLVVAVSSYAQSKGVEADLAAWESSQPEQATKRGFDEVHPANERVVPLPAGWTGSEYAISYEDPLGDRVAYRVVCAAKIIGSAVVLASVYAPDSLARDQPQILGNLLASAR